MQRRSLVVLVSCLALVWPPTAASAGDPPVVLVAETDAGVVQLDPSTGAVVRLIVPGGHDPAVSPDGRRLVFGLRNGYTVQHLWVSDIDGSNRRQLTSGTAFDATPDWSPDGRLIALCRATGEWPARSIHLAVVGSTGSGGRAITGTDGGCAPSWSPDSGLLAYTARDGVRVTDLEGRTNDLLCTCGWNPDWSPDGSTVAVAGGGTSEGNITLVDVRSGQAHTITEFEGYHLIWQEPVWAPDGASLYTSMLTESFPDENGDVRVGTAIEHRDRDGTRDNAFWPDGARSPGIGGGPVAAPDATPPAPVGATATAVISGIDVDVTPQAEPDAAGVVVRYAPGDEAPATPADGLAGGRSVRGHVALRHLAAETTYSISVFPLDWSGNVGPRTVTAARTPHEVGTALRITAAPAFVTYGDAFVLAGELRREDTGSPVEGAQLQLFGQLRGQPERLLATLITDSRGAVTSRRLPSGETTYRLRYAGADPLQPATAEATTKVGTRVSTLLSTSTVRRGGRATVTVRLRPVMSGAKVYVLQRINGKLRNRWTALTSSAGVATVALDTRIRGSYQVTAFTYGDGLRIYGSSPPRAFWVV